MAETQNRLKIRKKSKFYCLRGIGFEYTNNSRARLTRSGLSSGSRSNGNMSKSKTRVTDLTHIIDQIAAVSDIQT